MQHRLLSRNINHIRISKTRRVKIRKISPAVLTIGLIMAIMVYVSSNINWGDNRWKGILESDAKGYYAYLPAVFIYHDLNFGFFDSIEKGTYYDENFYYDYRAFVNGSYISKYYAGTALAQLPFFLTAHGLSHAGGYVADGYSRTYMIFVNLAALFYLLAGLIFLNQTLILYSISERNRILVLITAVFGTNLFFYATAEPGMSHVYSFGYISAFLYFAVRFFRKPSAGLIPVLFFLSGMIVLIRPVNGIVLLALPMAAGGSRELTEGVKAGFARVPALAGGLLLLLTVVSVQLIYYKMATGKFLVYSYLGEGFDFLRPHFYDILFSFRKGLFVYTPVYLLSFAGCIYLWRTKRFMLYSWLVFFFLITWIFSSWSNWYYGGSFSSRVYVEFLPFFMMLLGLAFQFAGSRIIRKVLFGITAVLILLCQIQTYQYRHHHIHWSDMTREMYFDVFLRVDSL